MTTYFISRHPGAIEWARTEGIAFDRVIAHLDEVRLGLGDTVLGTLPVNRAAEVCAAGARFLNLSIDLSAAARGRELSAKELCGFGARLEEFRVMRGEASA